MKYIRLQTIALCFLFCAAIGQAQQPPQRDTAVPKLVRISGSFQPATGRPANGSTAPSVESVTLSVYRDQTGGTALWQEIQNVAVNVDGNYSLVMGATQPEGMPMDLFASGEPRWLGTQVNRPGEAEQPRVLMVSVPYALKASDAETLGGRPASAYLLAAPTSTGAADPSAAGSTPTPTAASSNAMTAVKPRTTAGVMNFVAKFADATGDLTNSTMYDTNGFVGFGTTAPNHRLHVFNSSPIVDSNLSGQLYVQNTYPTNSQGHASLVLDKGSATASAALSFNSVGVQVWDVGATDDNNFHIRSLGTTNPKPVTIEHGAAANSLYINASGNVGIGTATPASKLDVAGDVNFTGSLLNQGSAVLQVPGGLVNQSIALGLGALASNTTGGENSAVGAGALKRNTGGYDNTATGFAALAFNTIGYQNTAAGAAALQGNTSGVENTATGTGALFNNTVGSSNIALGVSALQSNTSGSNNIAIGPMAAFDVSGGNSNNIHIGSEGVSSDSAAIRIGTAFSDADCRFPTSYCQTSFFAAGIRGVTTANNDAIPVVIDSNGQLGTISSSRRFKEDIEDMGAASNDLMRLRPVTYRYKQPFADGSKPIQYGLIAEEVAEVYPDLVAHSADGQIETVKYQVLDSMLLNEIQRQQAESNAQKEQIRRLEERLGKLEAALTSISTSKR